jgi:hypothetical protein
MIEPLVRNYVRQVLLEMLPAGTVDNYAWSSMDANSMQTPNDTQFTYEDSSNIDIEIYPTSDGTTHVKITSLVDDKLSAPERSFSNEEEARSFARAFVEKHNRIIMSMESS